MSLSLINEYLIKKYIKMVLDVFYPETTGINGKYNFRCNVCGDSKRAKHKKRGWFYTSKKGGYRFRCFNCGASVKATSWLKTYHPDYYNQYIKEILSNDKTEDQDTEVEVKEKKRITDAEKKNLSFFKPILSSQDKIFTKAVEYCEGRKIFKEEYKNWYVATDGRYKNRVIIPIYDKHNKIVFWQGRTLVGSEPKYLNSKNDTERAIISQIENSDTSMPIIAVEGRIDSIFIENGICTFSTNWSEDIQAKLDDLDVYYLIDYDKNNKEVSKRKIDLLKQGKYIFNWHKYLKANGLEDRSKWDVNDLYIHLNRNSKFTFSDFKSYFTNNAMDNIYFV